MVATVASRLSSSIPDFRYPPQSPFALGPGYRPSMPWLPPFPEQITEAMLSAAFPVLTHAECRVLRWVVCGKTDRVIAVILDLASSTVTTHVRNLIGKLGVESRLDAAMEVVRVIICRPPESEP